MEKDQIVEDVEASPGSESMQLEASPLSEAPIVVDLEASLHTLCGNAKEAENFTIFRIPHGISQSKENFFVPSVISIGPFHRGKKHLRAMEEQKRRFLRDFLSRGEHICLDLCKAKMRSLEESTRRCYSETVDIDSNAFVEMMLLDGCFVLEYFLKRYEGENLDSIYEVGWSTYFIKRDLVLLENQIPFFIVDKLYEIYKIDLKQEDKMDFIKYLVDTLLPKDYIFPDPPSETPDTKDSIIADPVDSIPDSTQSTDSTHSTDSTEFLDEIPDPPAVIHHLVHLCYHYLVPKPEKPVVLSSKSFDLTRMFSDNRIIKALLHRFSSRSKSTKDNISSMVVSSATELKQKGLKFAEKSEPEHMLDISFEYGVLKIPRLQITDFTKPLFANLLAFEHSKYRKEHCPFGRFLSFLDKLVNTPNDVIILQECGILKNWLGSEEELAHFLNQVTEGNMLTSNHYLKELYKEVNIYTESSWHRHRAKLIHDYFSSPWAAISLIAALILLVLTCVQSFYAVYAYHVPPSS